MKFLWKALALYFLTSSVLMAAAADSEAQAMHTAAAYFDAKAYDQAGEIYEKLLKAPLDEWKKDLIRYDLGTVLLSQGKWKEALSQFNAIPKQSIPTPVLRRRLFFNMALAYLKGEKLQNEISQKVFLLRQALQALSLAQQADCDLSKLEGGACASDPDIKHLQIYAKAELALALLKEREMKLNPASNDLQHLIRAGRPIGELIQNLASLYLQGLAQDPLQETTLTALQTSQSQIESILNSTQAEQSAELKIVKEGLKNAGHSLNLSLQMLKKNQAQQAHLFLEAAYLYIKRILTLLQDFKTHKPADILTEAIADQKDALSLTRLAAQTSNLEDPHSDPDLNQILLNLQNDTLAAFQPFAEAVYLLQKELFQANNCQEKPWNEVLPLTEKGRQAAGTAQDYLKKGSVPRDFVIAKQEEAMKNWQLALEKLQQYKMPETNTGSASKPQTFQQVLRLLEEMNQQDRIQPTEKAPIKEGLRPW